MFSDQLNQWFDYIECRLSPKTVKVYKYAVNLFKNTTNHNNKIHPLNVELFITKLRKSGLSTKTCDTYLAPIKSYYRWLSINYEVENPTKQIKFFRSPSRPIRVLSDQEYKSVLKFAPRIERNIIQFLANTGLRKSEFFNLTKESFIQNYSYIRINGKGNKYRLVPLNDICKRLIHDHIKQYGRINSPSELYRPKLIYLRFQRIAKKARIPPFTPHSLRHYFATRLIRQGVPIIIVSKILGHANVLITEQIYVHLCPQDLQVTNCLQF